MADLKGNREALLNTYMASKIMKNFVILALFISLSACVTTTDSPFTRKANTQEALDKYVQLGLEYIKRDEYSRARKHLERALEIDENNAPANAALGLIYQDEGEAKLAEEAFVTALDSEPGYTRGRTYYGAFLFSEQRYEKALGQFTLAAEDVRYESRAQIFTNIALCNLKLGRQEQALTAYEKALRLDRMNGRALSGITELNIEMERYERANQYYSRLVQLIAQQGLKHSPQSLWQGIRIAKYFGSLEQMTSFGSLLGELYPASQEYKQYQLLRSSGS